MTRSVTIRRLAAAARPRRAVTLVAVALVACTSVVMVSARAAAWVDPTGRLEVVTAAGPGATVSGWALDPNTGRPINVLITANKGLVTKIGANQPRPDIAARYPKWGPNHGFRTTVTLNDGTWSVCAIALNTGAGQNKNLGCKTVTVANNPSGSLDWVSQIPGGFHLYGGARDPNTTAPIDVEVYADGALLPGTLRADRSLHGGHGYIGSYLLAAGTHRICTTGVNVGFGRNAQLHCKTVTLNYSPKGEITELVQTPGGFKVTGWATDPDTTNAIPVDVYADGKLLGRTTANGAGSVRPGHGFAATYRLTPGKRLICVNGINVSFGSSRTVACRYITLNYNPTAAITAAAQSAPGVRVTGWAVDPDTASPVKVVVSADGGAVKTTVLADRTSTIKPGHGFDATVALGNGKHEVCVVAVNALFGSGDSPKACRTVTLNFDPIGKITGLTRAKDSSDLVVSGWAIDPDTTKPISVTVAVDGQTRTTAVANISRSDVQAAYPAFGPAHGYSVTVPADDKEHTVCVTGVNVGTGANKSVGCQLIFAVNPVVPSAPTAVKAVPDYGAATVSWTPPTDDGGAPWTSYVVTSSPGGFTVKVGASATSARVGGLKSATSYTFSVKAVNVAGMSPAGTSPSVKTPSSPPPQTTPAPISTSRYIRNITGASATDLAKLRSAGVADARANPSGHRYLMLLDIGGQSGSGVVLSATTRYISNAALLANMKAYVDGYASAQKPSAPAHITVGTNNDIDVTYAAGVTWARQIVNPLVTYAKKYPGIVISGANDIEPGFRGSYTATRSWLQGYLSATSAKFVFNGSADGCAWTVTNRACNNGWTMAALHNLSAGMAPSRIVSLPQIYNNTMAAQWKYISLTGVQLGKPRINFGGPLTEWTACAQAGSCGSLTGNYAWSQMWKQLQSHPALKVDSLPYSTDLRIDR